MRRIAELFLRYPFGNRQMKHQLRREGVSAGHHRVRRLMRIMGLEAILPGAENQPAASGAPHLSVSAPRCGGMPPRSSCQYGISGRFAGLALSHRSLPSGQERIRVSQPSAPITPADDGRSLRLMAAPGKQPNVRFRTFWSERSRFSKVRAWRNLAIR
ncbi:MAG: IS3 family transposase [Stellaceae bacterium]